MTSSSGPPRFVPYSPARVYAGGEATASPHFAARVVGLSDSGALVELEFDSDPGPDRPAAGAFVHVEVEDGARVLAFDGRVAAARAGSPLSLCVTRPTDGADYVVVQQRQTLRAPLQGAVTVSMQDGDAAVLRGVYVDLGGGGARIRTRSELAPGAHVRLRIALEAGKEPIAATAEVVDCGPVRPDPQDPEAVVFESRLSFEALPDAVQSLILQACYRQQIEHRRRRLELEP